MPLRNASDGSDGMDGVLARQERPVPSTSATSVKVPPISTATARLVGLFSVAISGKLIEVGIAVEGFCGRAVGAEPRRRIGIELLVSDDDAIEGPGGVCGDETAADVFEHAFCGTIIGMAHAATATRANAQDVTLLEGRAVGKRRDLALLRRARIDDDRAAAAGHAAGIAPRRILDAIDADGEEGLVGQDFVFADDAGAAAEAARAAGIGHDAVLAQADR